VSRTAMTSRKFSSDCGVKRDPHVARSVYQTPAATPRSMTALEVVQKSMIHMSATLNLGGGSHRTVLGARYVPSIVTTEDVNSVYARRDQQ
jgi:hypothetical protein